MWTSNDFAALDQVTTGQMRTIYRSEQRQASLPANASRMAFQLTGLSITVTCYTGSPAIFVAYADTDVFDLWTGVQHVAMVFQRGRPVETGTAVTHPGGSARPALCTTGTPPVTPPVLAPSSYTPDLARVLTRAATGAAQTSDTHSASAGLSARNSPDGSQVATPRPAIAHHQTGTFITTYTAIDPLGPGNATVTLDGFSGWPLTAAPAEPPTPASPSPIPAGIRMGNLNNQIAEPDGQL